jgi:hypothetical protein
MTDDASQQAHFEFLPADGRGPATVWAAGDIDLTAVIYCDSAAIRALITAARQARLTIAVGTTWSVTNTLLKVSGVDQVATVVTLG